MKYGRAKDRAAIGTDTVGARAIYAPTPVIPDDLREDVMQTEAVARFNVSFDGTSEVTLEKPTSSPRLNQVLLDALKQWKFFPAVKNGVAIRIDVRSSNTNFSSVDQAAQHRRSITLAIIAGPRSNASRRTCSLG